MLQSYHQSGETFELIFNKAKYDALPAELKAILKYAAESRLGRHVLEGSRSLFEGSGGHSAGRGVTGEEDAGRRAKAQLDAWNKVIEEFSKDPFFKKVIDSQKAWVQRT